MVHHAVRHVDVLAVLTRLQALDHETAGAKVGQLRLARRLVVGVEDQEPAVVGELGGHARLDQAHVAVEGRHRLRLQLCGHRRARKGGDQACRAERMQKS